MSNRLAARPLLAATLLAAVLAGGPACSGKKAAPPPRAYQLTGEVVAIKPDRTQVTVKHHDVVGFMPAMTMPFNVKEPRQLDGISVGDLLQATLMVTDEGAWLTGIRRTGTLPPEKRSGARGEPMRAELEPGMALPPLDLIGQDGRTRPFSSYRGSFVLLTFIYTSCPLPDYCPRMDKYFAALQRGILASPPLRKSVRLLSISFDPDIDTPAVLRQHAGAVGANDAVWRFATAADAGTVEAFGSGLGLDVVREGTGGRQITHNLRTALVDRDGKLVRIYNGNDWNPEAVLGDLVAAVK